MGIRDGDTHTGVKTGAGDGAGDSRVTGGPVGITDDNGGIRDEE